MEPLATAAQSLISNDDDTKEEEKSSDSEKNISEPVYLSGENAQTIIYAHLEVESELELYTERNLKRSLEPINDEEPNSKKARLGPMEDKLVDSEDTKCEPSCSTDTEEGVTLDSVSHEITNSQ